MERPTHDSKQDGLALPTIRYSKWPDNKKQDDKNDPAVQPQKFDHHSRRDEWHNKPENNF